MAEAVVSFVIASLGDFIRDEAKFLYGVSHQVGNARLELDRMRSFLKDADAANERHQVEERIRNWLQEIKEAAYDLADVIETFALKVALRSRRPLRLKNGLRLLRSILSKGVELHKVGSQIEEIMTRMSNVKSSLQAYGVNTDQLRAESDGGGSGWGSSSFNERQRIMKRRTYSHVMERDIVGFEDSVEELVAVLLEESTSNNNNKVVDIHRVVPICGMVGSGKTTLAKLIYHHKRMRRHFKSFAWVYVSQKYQTRDVWEGILIALASPIQSDERKKIAEMRVEELAKKIYDVVKEKKCLVILDDVWTIEAWNSLKAAFPNEDDVKSKILITTRSKLRRSLRGEWETISPSASHSKPGKKLGVAQEHSKFWRRFDRCGSSKKNRVSTRNARPLCWFAISYHCPWRASI